MNKLIYLILLTVSPMLFAEIKVYHLSIDYYKIHLKREPYQPELDEEWTNGGNFNLNLDFFNQIKMENRLHMDGVDAKLMNAGWEFKVYLDTFRQIKPFYYHHSEHSLDIGGNRESRDFPQTDTYGINFCIIGC